MSNTVIDIENISKQYMLGSFGTGTLSHDLNRWWARVRGKEDPFLRVGDTNDRTKKSDSDFVWALRDISFKVEQGDVVGIIGKNGAGKSTLLKILSRVTSPTLGSIKIKGRLASLLEVGTGFHSEMTDRQNMLVFKNKDGMPMASYALGHYKGKLIACPKGDFSFLRRIALPKILNKGLLYVDLFLHHPMMEWQMWMNNCCVLECEGYQEGFGKALDMPNYGIMGLDDFQ